MATRSLGEYNSDILAVSCSMPKCQAQPRRRCHTPEGLDTKPHQVRVRAAVKAAQDEDVISDGSLPRKPTST